MLWAAWDTLAYVLSDGEWSEAEVTGYNSNSEQVDAVTCGFQAGDHSWPNGGTLRISRFGDQWRFQVVGGSGTVYISRIVGIK